MAGGAAKRLAKESASIKQKYSVIAGLTLVLKLIYSIYSGWDAYTVFGCAILVMINSVCLPQIFENAATGLPYSTYQDVLFVTWFITVATCFSSYFWYLFLVVPAYFLYSISGTLIRFFKLFCGSKVKDDDEVDIKKKKKKERQEARYANRR